MPERYASLKQGLVGAWIPSVSGSGLLLPDVSGRGNNGTLTNMASDDWVSWQYGRALDFDASDDNTTISNVQLTSAFTGSAWFYKRTNGVSNERCVLGNSSSNDTYLPLIGPTSIRTQSNSVGTFKTYSFTISNLIWYHVAIVRDLANNTRVFLNGVESSSGAQSVTGTYTLNRIGQYSNATGILANFLWDGQLDDIRIYNRALSASEIRLLASEPGIGFKPAKKLSRFSQRFTYEPPKAKTYSVVRVKETDHANLREGLVGAWCPSIRGSGNLLPDQSGYGNHGTLTNMASDDWVSGQYGRAVDFSYTAGASRQAIELPNLASVRGLEFASISMWVNLKTAPSVQAALYFEPTSSDGFTKFGLFQSTTNQIVFVARDTASGSSFAVTATPTVGAWVHVCGTYNAVTDRMELFFNGVSAGTNLTAKGALHDSAPASVMAIGAFTQNTLPNLQYTCSAFIDDIRIYNRALSESEIRLLASRPGIGLRQDRDRQTFYQFPSGSRRRLLLTGHT